MCDLTAKRALRPARKRTAHRNARDFRLAVRRAPLGGDKHLFVRFRRPIPRVPRRQNQAAAAAALASACHCHRRSQLRVAAVDGGRHVQRRGLPHVQLSVALLRRLHRQQFRVIDVALTKRQTNFSCGGSSHKKPQNLLPHRTMLLAAIV